jgi:hypothetical protein
MASTVQIADLCNAYDDLAQVAEGSPDGVTTGNIVANCARVQVQFLLSPPKKGLNVIAGTLTFYAENCLEDGL